MVKETRFWIGIVLTAGLAILGSGCWIHLGALTPSPFLRNGEMPSHAFPPDASSQEECRRMIAQQYRQFSIHEQDNPEQVLLIGDALVVKTRSGCLLRFDPETGRPTHVWHGSATVVAICPWPEGGILVADESGRLCQHSSADLRPGRQVARVSAPPFYLKAWRNPESGRSEWLAFCQELGVGSWKETIVQSSGRKIPFLSTEHMPMIIAVLFRPSAFLLDSRWRLWVGWDAGEWSGAISCVELQTGKVHYMQDFYKNVAGLRELEDGRVVAWGGRADMGFANAFVSRVDEDSFRMLYMSNDDDSYPSAPRPDPALCPRPVNSLPQMVPDGGGGFWATDGIFLFHSDAQFREWEKVAQLNVITTHGSCHRNIVLCPFRDGVLCYRSGALCYVQRAASGAKGILWSRFEVADNSPSNPT